VALGKVVIGPDATTEGEAASVDTGSPVSDAAAAEAGVSLAAPIGYVPGKEAAPVTAPVGYDDMPSPDAADVDMTMGSLLGLGSAIDG
jgi:hypothetical protein